MIDGLYGLHFGNGTVSGDRNALYFAAGPDGGAHGLFGSLRLAPARVASVVVNDGSAQRSMVKSLTVNFDGPVTIDIDAGAFELRRQDGTLVDLTVATSMMNGRTVAVLTFAGPGIVGWLAGGRELRADDPRRPHSRRDGPHPRRRRRRRRGWRRFRRRCIGSTAIATATATWICSTWGDSSALLAAGRVTRTTWPTSTSTATTGSASSTWSAFARRLGSKLAP